MAMAANNFLQNLTSQQNEKAQFLFDDQERYNWHFIPRDRKGISLKELNKAQQEAAMNLLHAALSDTGFKKTTAIIKLEGILRDLKYQVVITVTPVNIFFPFLAILWIVFGAGV